MGTDIDRIVTQSSMHWQNKLVGYKKAAVAVPHHTSGNWPWPMKALGKGV
jgi:hypothetical protein